MGGEREAGAQRRARDTGKPTGDAGCQQVCKPSLLFISDLLLCSLLAHSILSVRQAAGLLDKRPVFRRDCGGGRDQPRGLTAPLSSLSSQWSPET